MSPTRFPLILSVVALSPVAIGCGSKKIVASLRPQQPGEVTYSASDGKPVWTTTGSAKYVKSVPLKGSFPREPHFTYIVFRDEQKSEDHVMAMEAAGDLTTTDQNGVETKDEGSLLRVIKVKADQPSISVSLKVKGVELIDLGGGKDEPRITIWSNGKVRLKYPALLHLDDEFGLDEVKSIKHTKNLDGSGTITFALVEKEFDVPFPNGENATSHYADLERVVKAMAPHVELSSGRNWWMIVIAVIVVLVIIGAIIAKNSEK